jgi:hypothetical protein|tara:strand:+ start:120 stop:422 length:303 start_codon:yes stop_codon:yes gene_type:complete
MAEELTEVWCVFFQKDGNGQDLEDPSKPKRLYLFDNTDGVKWHDINETDSEDMKAMIGHLQEEGGPYAMMLIPPSACTSDENGILNGITFPSEFTGFAGS